MEENNKTCLILGGGGARGLSHLGVLEVLEREGVRPDCIIGTSVGAVVGAVYALEPDAKKIAEHARQYFVSEAFRKDVFKQIFLKSEEVEQNFFRSVFSGIRKSYVFSNLLRRRAIFPGDRLQAMIADLVPDVTFAETNLPFSVPALDIRSGREVLLTSGSLRQAVLASCSLPGFFPPVEQDGMLLVDAGTIAPVPVTAAKEYFQPTRTIAVDITSNLDQFSAEASGLDVILRVDSIACKRLNRLELDQADAVIRPDVGDRYWSDFSDFDQLFEQGILAAEASVPKLKQLFESRAPVSLWERLVGSLKGGRAAAR